MALLRNSTTLGLNTRTTVPSRLSARPAVIGKSRLMPAQAAFGARGVDSVEDAGWRGLAAATYFLPFADSLRYGRYLFSSYPSIENFFSPLFPAVADFHGLSYGSLLLFFAILLGVVMNRKVSQFARFNGMQALVLEVIAVVPYLLGSLFDISLHGAAYDNGCTFLWLFLAFNVVLGVLSSVLGTYIRLPYVTDWAGKYFP